MRQPSMPEPFSGSDPSHTSSSLHGPVAGGKVDFFGNDSGITTIAQEQHWKDLDKFFAENEQAIAKAERAAMDSGKIQDYGTTMDLLTDTANIILDGLTALAHVHPALGVAIFAFHAIIRLDLTRRDNDKKVVAVKLQMQTMMCAMFQFRKLRHIHVAEDDRDVENQRLQRLIGRITEEIKACGSDLNYYTERSTVSRVISSKVYEARFAGHIATFSQRRSELQNAITTYTAVGVDAANIGIASIGEKVTFLNVKLDSVIALLQSLNSPRERDLLKFLEANGGPDKCIDDDRLLNRLLAMSGESKKSPTAGSDGREEQQQLTHVRRELKNDLKNLDTLLTQNFSRFEKLLEIQSNNLRIHMEDTSTKLDQIVANTMLIIDQGKVIEKSMAANATLKDPVLQAVWDSMGLKSSVKAKHFILNFRDHISMERTPSATPMGSPAPSIGLQLPPTDDNDDNMSDIVSNVGSVSNQVFKDELKDEWALRYLTVSYVHPIIEAMDEDCSGFISVKEANKFARARPPGTSLISWMAYWAVGWHRNLTKYKEQIYSIVLQMHYLSKKALPHNQRLIKSYLNSFTMMRVEALLRSIRSLQPDFDIENDGSLNTYATAISTAQEEQLTQNLDGISYVLRSVNDVKLIANHGKLRVETWILPVLYLVLKRHLDIIVLAQKNLIHSNEMAVHEETLGFIFHAFEERLNRLKAIFHQVYRGNVEAHFEVFAYGMFFSFFKGEKFCPSESVLHREEWARYYETSYSAEDTLAKDPPDISILAEGLGTRFKFEQKYNDDEQTVWEGGPEGDQNEGATDGNSNENADTSAQLRPHPLEGVWSIRCSQRIPFSMNIESVRDGKITGEACFILGRGYITGDYKREKGTPGGILDFDILMLQDDADDETRFFSATYDPEREIITGTWTIKITDPVAEQEYFYEGFVARRIPLQLYFLREIIDGTLESLVGSDTLARLRWRFAIECVRSQTKPRLNSKSLTVARFNASRQLMKLHYESLGRGDFGNIQTEDYRKMILLGLPHSSISFTLYRRVVEYRYERMLDDCGIRFYSCDNCSEHITHVRYQCITCTNEKFNSEVDLCHKCRDIDGVNSINRVTNFVHRTSHSLLRSTPRSWIKMHELAWLIPEARLTSEKVKARFRELTHSDGAPSKMSNPSVGRNKSNHPPQCSLCRSPILALPTWTCLMCGSDVLICSDCVLNKTEADSDDHVLLRIFDNVRVWPSEAKSTRLEEHIEDMESRINMAVADELSTLRTGIDNRMKALESQVNNQLGEILSMMKLVLGRTA